MRILRVELENIKSYERASIEFTEGVNAIVGLNGAGKSTILEAVGFALFSSLDYSQSAFLREGAKHGTVTVAFESQADGRIYQAVRKIGGAGTKQAIYDADLDVNLAEGDPDVERFLRIHLGLLPNADLKRIFKDAVGVPQGTLTAVFLLTTAQRKAIFDSLLQVDDYKTAFDNLLRSKQLLMDRHGEAATVIARLEGILAALPDIEQRALSSQVELATTQTALAEAQATLAQFQAQLASLEEKRAAVLAAENERGRAQQAFAAGQTTLAVAQVRLREALEARALVANNQPGYDRYVEAQRTQQRLDQRLQKRQQAQLDHSAAASALALADQQARQAADELDRIAAAEAAVAALKPAAEQQAALEAERAAVQAQQGALRGAESAVALAERSFAQEQAKLEALRKGFAEIAAAEAELAGINLALAALNEEKSQLNEARTQKNAEGLKLKDQNDELNKVSGAICPVCEGPLTPADRRKLLQRNDAQMDALRIDLRKLIDAAAALQAQGDELDRARRSQETILHKLPSAAAVAEQGARVAELIAQQDAAQARRAELAGAPAALLGIEAALTQLGNPAQQIAVARATADRRAVTAAAQQRADAAAASASARLAALQVSLSTFSELDAEIEAVQADKSTHFAAYQAVLSNQQAAQTVTARQAALSTAADESEALQVALARAEQIAEAAAAQFDVTVYRNAQEQSARLHGEVGSLSSTEKMLARERDDLNRQIAALRADQKNLAQAQLRLNRIEQQAAVLDKMRTVINQAGPYVTAHMIHKVSVTAAQIFGELAGDFSQLLEWGEDYAISLAVDGRKRTFQALSGGEQMVAALAVRLALLKTITGISMAFFDEPTANLDAQRREALAGQILAFKGLRQLFVISHDDTFEHATDNTVHLTRVNGASRVVEGGAGNSIDL